MRITKYVEYSAETEIDIDIDDISAALSEQREESTARFINSILKCLIAISDEKISDLTCSQRQLVNQFLVDQSLRYKIKDNALLSSKYKLPEITEEDKKFLHYNPNTSDIVEWVEDYAIKAIKESL